MWHDMPYRNWNNSNSSCKHCRRVLTYLQLSVNTVQQTRLKQHSYEHKLTLRYVLPGMQLCYISSLLA